MKSQEREQRRLADYRLIRRSYKHGSRVHLGGNGDNLKRRSLSLRDTWCPSRFMVLASASNRPITQVVRANHCGPAQTSQLRQLRPEWQTELSPPSPVSLHLLDAQSGRARKLAVGFPVRSYRAPRNRNFLPRHCSALPWAWKPPSKLRRLYHASATIRVGENEGRKSTAYVGTAAQPALSGVEGSVHPGEARKPLP